MKQTVRSKPRFFALVGLILILMGVGIVMIYRVFDRYEDLVLQNADNQLIGLTRSVERSVENYLERYVDNLTHMTGHSEVCEAEKIWLDGGSSEELLECIEENLLNRNEKIVTVLVLKDNEIQLSTNGDTDYYFPPQAGKQGKVSVGPCLNKNSFVYLAFCQETGKGVKYVILVDLISFYEQVAGNLTMADQDKIMLLDAGGRTFIHRRDGYIRVDPVERLTEENCQFRGLSFLLEQQKLGQEGTTFYDACVCSDGQPYKARMAVVPATEDTNGYFAVGVSTNYDQVIKPLRLGAVRLGAYGSMVVLGIILLLILLLHAARGNQRALKEVETLRAKNEAMEALNEQTQKLAHHQRLETMGVLASGIAHEFNNLLTPIMGYSMLALEKLPSDEADVYDDILEVYNTSVKAKKVISRLSDMFRKNADTVFKCIVLDHLVAKTVEVAKPVQPEHVETHLELNCKDLKMYGNETQLSQLVLNLVLNSFHAMEQKGGVLTVITDSDSEKIYLSVTDDGCGIPKKVLPHIFDPFFTTKDAKKGTGLGMMIVWQVVEEHKGKIKVESEEGMGTTVRIEFPVSGEK